MPWKLLYAGNYYQTHSIPASRFEFSLLTSFTCNDKVKIRCFTDSTCRYMYYLWSVVDHNKTTKAYSSCPLAKEQNLLVIGLGLPSLCLAYFYSGNFLQTSQKLREEPQKKGRNKLLPAMICHVSVLNFHILEISHTTVV